jgi:hypothetical protein
MHEVGDAVERRIVTQQATDHRLFCFDGVRWDAERIDLWIWGGVHGANYTCIVSRQKLLTRKNLVAWLQKWADATGDAARQCCKAISCKINQLDAHRKSRANPAFSVALRRALPPAQDAV